MSFKVDVNVSLYKSRVFTINEQSMSYDDLQMDLNDITGFCYGAIANTSVGVKVSGSHYFKFVDKSGDAIEFGMFSSPLVNQRANTETANNIESAVWEYLGNRMLNDLVRTIHSGQSATIGEARINKDGVHFIDKRYASKMTKYSIPWTEAMGRAENGSLVIQSKTNPNAMCVMKLRETLNAHLLHRIFHYIGSNEYLRDVLRGIQPPLA